MRRISLTLPVATLALTLALAGSVAPEARAQSDVAVVPHAWLFGSWTGGLFPAPSNLTAEACLSQPVVIFTRDVVLRATLMDTTYRQRVIATARATGKDVEFRFAPAPAEAPSGGMMGLAAPAGDNGFGCDDPDVLHVQRHTENEISFPGCAEFPNPLVRCPRG